jgi:hypothetical protein
VIKNDEIWDEFRNRLKGLLHRAAKQGKMLGNGGQNAWAKLIGLVRNDQDVK